MSDTDAPGDDFEYESDEVYEIPKPNILMFIISNPVLVFNNTLMVLNTCMRLSMSLIRSWIYNPIKIKDSTCVASGYIDNKKVNVHGIFDHNLSTLSYKVYDENYEQIPVLPGNIWETDQKLTIDFKEGSVWKYQGMNLEDWRAMAVSEKTNQ